MFPGLAAHFHNHADFLAGVLCVIIVHDVQKGSEIIISLVVAANAVVDSDKPHALVLEKNICVKPDFQIVTPEPAHVLDYDCCVFPGLHLGDHGLESLAVKGRAAHAVVYLIAVFDTM